MAKVEDLIIYVKNKMKTFLSDVVSGGIEVNLKMLIFFTSFTNRKSVFYIIINTKHCMGVLNVLVNFVRGRWLR